MNRNQIVPFFCVILLISVSCSNKPTKPDGDQKQTKVEQSSLIMPGEVHFKSIKQLTFGGENAEAYFNADGTELIFQSTRDDLGCDQIFRMTSEGEDVRMVSTGEGRTTCGYLFPEGERLIYSSSHATMKACPPRPDYSKGYVWPLLADLDIYVAGANGENPKALSPSPGYDAEGVISPDGSRILFTSTRGGDIDIWSMNPDGEELKQLTDEVGYDGGAFFSPDGKKIVWRANYPTTESATKDYKDLLAANLVRPSVMNLYTMDSDGKNKKQILANGAANFAPYFHPDGKRIVFASNMDAPQGRDFELYIINVDGSGLQRVTYNASFDAFPMFSFDGTKIVFASNRGGKTEGETNVFIAEWTDDLPTMVDETVGAAAPESTRWKTTVSALTAAEMGGRGLGSDELERAAVYIEGEFKKVGLEPVFDGTFRQTFETVVSSEVEKATFKIGSKAAKLNQEFRPFPFSGNAQAKTKLRFVGYGITAPNYEYDDYRETKIDGDIAVAFRFEPERKKEQSKFEGKEAIRESALRFKAFLAEHHGAGGLVIINPPDVDSDTLHTMDDAPNATRIPVVHLTYKAAKKLLGSEVDQLWAEINNGKFEGPKPMKSSAEVSVKIKQVKKPTSNVVGKIAGSGDSYFVVGAHYDHLGHGGPGSLASGSKEAHPGADDNASGVATVIDLARALKANGPPKHTIYFVAFSGEESGLLGSEYFVNNPPEPLEKADAMINFDMVGRPKNNKLNVLGTGTGKGFVTALRKASPGLDLNLTMTADGFGPSDQTPFYSRKIPVLHFFTGLHDDYHRPTDTVDKLDPDGAVRVGKLALRVIADLDETDVEFALVKNASPRSGRGDSGQASRGYGPYFGSVPSFGESKIPGVKISGTRPESPAEKAGLKTDDVIVKFGKFDVTSMQDYAFAIRQHKVGDEVEVVVVRKGKKLPLKATLTKKSKDKGSKNPHAKPK